MYNLQLSLTEFINFKNFDDRIIKFNYLNQCLQLIENNNFNLSEEILINFKKKFDSLNIDLISINDFLEKKNNIFNFENLEKNLEFLDIYSELIYKLILKLGLYNKKGNSFTVTQFFEIFVNFIFKTL